MILAGDIGGTNARIAFFEVEQRRLKRVYEHVYPTREHPNLESAVATFIDEYRVKPVAACFGIAGPVSRGRRAEMPNLNWVVDADDLAREIGIESVELLNDLEANAYGVGALEPSDLLSLNEGRAEASGNQGVIAAGTGLGEAGLYWGRQDSSTVRLRGWSRRLWARRRAADLNARLSAPRICSCELGAGDFRTRVV